VIILCYAKKEKCGGNRKVPRPGADGPARAGSSQRALPASAARRARSRRPGVLARRKQGEGEAAPRGAAAGRPRLGYSRLPLDSGVRSCREERKRRKEAAILAITARGNSMRTSAHPSGISPTASTATASRACCSCCEGPHPVPPGFCRLHRQPLRHPSCRQPLP